VTAHRALAAAALIVIGLSTAMVATEAATWPGADSGCVESEDCYCEAFREEGFATQPANTVSNLGFALVGLIILAGIAGRRADEPLAVTYGLVAVGLGVGSALFHGTITDWGGWADLVSMYLFICFYVAVNLGERYGWGVGRTLGVFGGVSAGLAAIQVPLDQGAGKFIFGGLIGGGLVTEVAVKDRDRRWLTAGVVVFVLSFVVWNLSRTDGAWCNPESLLQGHALWHLGAAVTVALLYVYQRPALMER